LAPLEANNHNNKVCAFLGYVGHVTYYTNTRLHNPQNIIREFQYIPQNIIGDVFGGLRNATLQPILAAQNGLQSIGNFTRTIAAIPNGIANLSSSITNGTLDQLFSSVGTPGFNPVATVNGATQLISGTSGVSPLTTILGAGTGVGGTQILQNAAGVLTQEGVASGILALTGSFKKL